MKITLSTGVTIHDEHAENGRVLIFTDPESVEHPQRHEAGRIVEINGVQGFQPAVFSIVAYTPEAVRAIAEFVESEQKGLGRATQALIEESAKHLPKSAYDELRGNHTAYRTMAESVITAYNESQVAK